MRPLAILIAGEPVPAALLARGSFGRMIREAVGDAWTGPWSELDARGPLAEIEQFSGLIISGSPANVPTREPWIVATERWLESAVRARTPIFGICFGHQLLAQALGGLVTRNPRGAELGTVSLQVVAADPLLPDTLPSFAVNMAHLDTVARLPPGARVLGRTVRDEYAAVYFGERAWGVQFHPEMDAEIAEHYLLAYGDSVPAEGAEAGSARRVACDTPASQALLRRFVQTEVGRQMPEMTR
jgi:GMP synthase (glutamine-hydrolysing)